MTFFPASFLKDINTNLQYTVLVLVRSAPFWDITRCRVFVYRRFGTMYRSIFKGQDSEEKNGYSC
jgi:hypothetical protein